jgi:hypothetical protein
LDNEPCTSRSRSSAHSRVGSPSRWWPASLWLNPATGGVEGVPRHTEIPNLLSRKICRGLGVPD